MSQEMSNSSKLAPIALIVFNRVEHLKLAIAALQQNELADQSDLFVYADGPRGQQDEAGVAEVRKLIRSISGVKTITIVDHDENWGLAKSIITATTDLTDRYGKVIVVEDDLVTSPGFLKYMNDALDLYADDEQVMQISAYIPPMSQSLPDTFFSRTHSTWGWGTWQRAWKHFNYDIEQLQQQLDATEQRKFYNLDGTYNFYKQIEDNISGKIKTWGIRWYTSMFLKEGLTLFPGKSLVNNMGNDGSGTNAGAEPIYMHEKLVESVKVERIEIQESQTARKALKMFHMRRTGTHPNPALNAIKNVLRMLPDGIKDPLNRLLGRS